MVVVDSSISIEELEYISVSLVYYDEPSVLEGEWIITMVECPTNQYQCKVFKEIENALRRRRLIKKGFHVEVKKGEEWKIVGVLRTIVDRLHSIGM